MHLPLLFYTLIGSLSDDPEFAHPDSCNFYVADQVYGENHRHPEELEFSYLTIFSRYSLTLLYSYYFHDSMHWTHACSIFLFICYHMWSFICYCSDIDLS